MPSGTYLSPFLKPGRLADLKRLIREVGTEEWHYRTEDGLSSRLGPPVSSEDENWITVAKEHPQFFFLSTRDEHPDVRLVTLRNKRGEQPLSVEEMEQLFREAEDYHRAAREG